MAGSQVTTLAGCSKRGCCMRLCKMAPASSVLDKEKEKQPEKAQIGKVPENRENPTIGCTLTGV